MFYANVHFHQNLLSLCGNALLIDTISRLDKRSTVSVLCQAFPVALDRARRDLVAMIAELRAARRDELIALTRRHLKPSPQAHIRAYERRFGTSADSPRVVCRRGRLPHDSCGAVLVGHGAAGRI